MSGPEEPLAPILSIRPLYSRIIRDLEYVAVTAATAAFASIPRTASAATAAWALTPWWNLYVGIYIINENKKI